MLQHSFDQTILSQYANSHRLIGLLNQFNQLVDPRKDIKTFYDEVFNLDTCGEYGLKVWGRIVAAPRMIEVVEGDYFGFYGSELYPFDQAPFFNGYYTSSMVTMSGEQYRRLIYFKAYVNIIQTTIPEIQKALWMLFGDNRAPMDDIYVQEHTEGVMTMRVVFRFTLSPFERALLRTYGYLLRPGGVGFKVYEIPRDVFGFFGSDLLPFDQGVFWNGSIGELVNRTGEQNALPQPA